MPSYENRDWTQPSMTEVLKAVPEINWRQCWNCGHVGVYAKQKLPECRCHECESADTRLMKQQTELIRRDSEPLSLT